MDSDNFGWVKGRNYYWEDFFTPLTGKFMGGDAFHAPSPAYTYFFNVVSVGLFLILAWYFDHVIATNRGVGQPFYFPFSIKYWKSVFCS